MRGVVRSDLMSGVWRVIGCIVSVLGQCKTQYRVWSAHVMLLESELAAECG